MTGCVVGAPRTISFVEASHCGVTRKVPKQKAATVAKKIATIDHFRLHTTKMAYSRIDFGDSSPFMAGTHLVPVPRDSRWGPPEVAVDGSHTVRSRPNSSASRALAGAK